MSKDQKTTERIKDEINHAMAESDDLDGDCRGCQVRRICPVTVEEAKQLGRNWNVDMVNGECRGECQKVLRAILDKVGETYEAIWS